MRLIPNLQREKDAGEKELPYKENGNDRCDIQRRQRQHASSDERRQEGFGNLVQPDGHATGWNFQSSLQEARE